MPTPNPRLTRLFLSSRRVLDLLLLCPHNPLVPGRGRHEGSFAQGERALGPTPETSDLLALQRRRLGAASGRGPHAAAEEVGRPNPPPPHTPSAHSGASPGFGARRLHVPFALGPPLRSQKPSRVGVALGHTGRPRMWILHMCRQDARLPAWWESGVGTRGTRWERLGCVALGGVQAGADWWGRDGTLWVSDLLVEERGRNYH